MYVHNIHILTYIYNIMYIINVHTRVNYLEAYRTKTAHWLILFAAENFHSPRFIAATFPGDERAGNSTLNIIYARGPH